MAYLWELFWGNCKCVPHLLIVWEGERFFSHLNALMKKLNQGIDLCLWHPCLQGKLCKLKILSGPEWCPWLRIYWVSAIQWSCPDKVFKWNHFTFPATTWMVFNLDGAVLMTSVICIAGLSVQVVCGGYGCWKGLVYVSGHYRPETREPLPNHCGVEMILAAAACHQDCCKLHVVQGTQGLVDYLGQHWWLISSMLVHLYM